MGSRDDYLEINLYLEDYEEDTSVSLWVHCRNREMLVFHDVRNNPVRYEGRWVIDHDFVDRRATSYIPSDDVWYFTVVHPLDSKPSDSDITENTFGTEAPLDAEPVAEPNRGFLVEL